MEQNSTIPGAYNMNYFQTSNISRTLVGNKIVDRYQTMTFLYRQLHFVERVWVFHEHASLQKMPAEV